MAAPITGEGDFLKRWAPTAGMGPRWPSHSMSGKTRYRGICDAAGGAWASRSELAGVPEAKPLGAGSASMCAPPCDGAAKGKSVVRRRDNGERDSVGMKMLRQTVLERTAYLNALRSARGGKGANSEPPGRPSDQVARPATRGVGGAAPMPDVQGGQAALAQEGQGARGGTGV